MILTSKALKDFEIWLFKVHAPFASNKDQLYNDQRAKTLLYALILEWLDEVRIYINIYSDFGVFGLEIKDSGNVLLYDHGFGGATRQIAMSNGIYVSNEIYNSSTRDYMAQYKPWIPPDEI